MRYMPILPVGMASLMDQNYIRDAFVLPQFWDNPEYKRMYMRRTWNTAIIDNAMYENPHPVPFDELIEIAENFTAIKTFVVAPEDHADPIHTAQLTIDTIDEFGSNGVKWQAMTIIHGTPLEIKEMYAMLDGYENLGYGVAVSTWRAGFDRTTIKSLSKEPHYFHAMGLDSISELFALKRAGFDTVDSSMCATAAVNKIPFNENTVIIRTGDVKDPKRVPITATPFQVEVTDQTEANIKAMKAWLS